MEINRTDVFEALNSLKVAQAKLSSVLQNNLRSFYAEIPNMHKSDIITEFRLLSEQLAGISTELLNTKEYQNLTQYVDIMINDSIVEHY